MPTSMPRLPAEWEPTRVSLQKYGQAITAHARAALGDPRWSHVALDPVIAEGRIVFRSAPIDLPDGGHLVGELDAHLHRVTVSSGDEVRHFDLTTGPSPASIGETMDRVAQGHGATIDVDRERFSDNDAQPYEPTHARAWSDNAAWIAETFAAANRDLGGEIAGPHLWPHGFDIATEWFSELVVDDEGSNAQIAAGFYPAGEAYFYVNPWPFEEAWADSELPGDAVWNVGDWNGAKLSTAGLDGEDDRGTVVDLINAVHSLVRTSLAG